MGLEAECTVSCEGKSARCSAHLETDRILVRGAIHLTIRFTQIESLEIRTGVLDVGFSGQHCRLDLGGKAEAWVQKIRSPKSLMDKLGVLPSSRISVIGELEPSLLAEFEGRAHTVSRRVAKGSELIFWRASRKSDLARLKAFREKLADAGALWVLWPKGQEGLREDDIRAALKPAGLVDVKVASVSSVLSGLKAVIPVALRGGKGSTARS